MNNFYNEFADEIALVNYDPWESAYENPENDIKDPCSELFRRIFVWWDGKVNPCDFDYKSTLSQWNAYKNSIVKVRTYKTTSKGRSTSTAVHSYAIQRSKGICESCDTPAPFETRNGTPYLEVHHLIPISKGGPDHPENVAAVCPNCHRRTEKSKDSDQFNNDIIKKVLAKEKEMGKV